MTNNCLFFLEGKINYDILKVGENVAFEVLGEVVFKKEKKAPNTRKEKRTEEKRRAEQRRGEIF